MPTIHKFLLIFLHASLLAVLVASAHGMERRRDQFNKEHAHYIVPVPISYPGLGRALAIGGIYANAHDSYTDYAGYLITGDLEGFGAVATDMHIIDRTLIAEAGAEKLSKVAVFSYNGRGMETSKDDYNIVQIDDVKSAIARLRGTFFERMLEVQAFGVNNEIHLNSLRRKDGSLLRDMSSSQPYESRYYMLAMQLDWTDDYQDPRKGLRYNISRWWRDETSADSSDYYQVEHNLTAYVPIGRISTWAFNYFVSDAFVTREGDTDFTSVEQRMGLDCTPLSGEERTQCEQSVNNTIAHNRYGTAQSMGGVSRLRSYPEGRYKGAHTVFWGTELRWNLTEEFQPFDFYVAKDIRTGVQLSAFWETASVADDKDKLGDIWRDSYGLGLRLVMTSGMVFRAEIADGDEGSNVVMFLNYPWADY